METLVVLLLRSRPHLLVKCTIRNLQARHGRQADVQDGQHDQRADEAHEDTRREELVLDEQRRARAVPGRPGPDDDVARPPSELHLDRGGGVVVLVGLLLRVAPGREVDDGGVLGGIGEDGANLVVCGTSVRYLSSFDGLERLYRGRAGAKAIHTILSQLSTPRILVRRQSRQVVVLDNDAALALPSRTRLVDVGIQLRPVHTFSAAAAAHDLGDVEAAPDVGPRRAPAQLRGEALPRGGVAQVRGMHVRLADEHVVVRRARGEDVARGFQDLGF